MRCPNFGSLHIAKVARETTPIYYSLISGQLNWTDCRPVDVVARGLRGPIVGLQYLEFPSELSPEKSRGLKGAKMSLDPFNVITRTVNDALESEFGFYEKFPMLEMPILDVGDDGIQEIVNIISQRIPSKGLRRGVVSR